MQIKGHNYRKWKVKRQNPNRVRLAKRIMHHRRSHFDGAYVRTRDFNWLLLNHEFDLRKYIAKKLGRKKQISILDSGAGDLNLSADIKKAFGIRARVTALTVIHPLPPPKLIKFIPIDPGQIPYGRTKIQTRGVTQNNAALVDRIKVSSAEKMQTAETYDIIIDLAGPTAYSPDKDGIYNNYFNHLKSNGVIFTDDPHIPIKFRGIFHDKNGKFSIQSKELAAIKGPPLRIPGKTGLYEMRAVRIK